MKKKSAFKPAWWLKNAHMQTLWPTFIRQPSSMDCRHERFELSDGDFVDCAWLDQSTQAPIILVLHGLTGSIQSIYAQGVMRALHQKGWRVVFMHFRGAGEHHNRHERAYDAGDTLDLNEFVQYLKGQEPHTPLACVGYSLGGNVLLKWLGETGAMNPLVAAVAISVPFDLNKVLNRFSKGFSRLYSRYLLSHLQEFVIDKFSEGFSPIDIEQVRKAVSFTEFDNRYTAPVHGFDSAYDYYQRASSKHYLKDIRVPTLIVHAEDDPFMTPDTVPDESELSEYVTMEVSPFGGHVGFVSGKWPWQAEYWLERRVPKFFEPYFLEYLEKKRAP